MIEERFGSPRPLDSRCDSRGDLALKEERGVIGAAEDSTALLDRVEDGRTGVIPRERDADDLGATFSGDDDGDEDSESSAGGAPCCFSTASR